MRFPFYFSFFLYIFIFFLLSSSSSNTINTESSSSSFPPSTECGGPRIYVGTHHKTGSRLLERTVATTCHVLKQYSCTHKVIGVLEDDPSQFSLRFEDHSKFLFKKKFGIIQGKFFHMIRDPFEMIASAFLYHKKGPEKWVRQKLPRQTYVARCGFRESLREICDEFYPQFQGEKTWAQILNEWPLEEAVIFETIRSIKDFYEMVGTYRTIQRKMKPGCGFNFNLKTSQKNFTEFVSTFMDFIEVSKPTDRLILSAVLKKLDINRFRVRSSNGSSDPHINSKKEEEKIIEYLKSDKRVKRFLRPVCKEMDLCKDVEFEIEKEEEEFKIEEDEEKVEGTSEKRSIRMNEKKSFTVENEKLRNFLQKLDKKRGH